MEVIAKEKYVSGERNGYYERKGSIVCAKIDCGRYGDRYISAVVSISSYGQKFVEDNNEKKVEALRRTMKYQILPYYNAMLEIEMASLSLRHSIDQKKKEKKSN